MLLKRLLGYKYGLSLVLLSLVCFVGITTKVLAVGSPEAPEFVGGADSGGETNTGTGATSFGSGSGDRDIFILGDYAYVTMAANAGTCSATAGTTNGCELKIFNISDPSNPTYIGGADSSGTTNSGTGGSRFYTVFVSGSYAYITKAGESTNCNTVGNKTGCELQVYDISTPSAPTFVGGADVSGGTNSGSSSSESYSVFVSGNYAYIVIGGNGTNCNTVNSKIGCELQVYDISTPSAPTFVGGADCSGNTNSGTCAAGGTFSYVFVSGSYAYILKADSATDCSTAGNKIGCELQIYDISTPSAPTFIGGADASGTTNSGTGSSAFNSVFVSGNYAYILKTGNATDCSTAGNKIGCELQIYDISTPSAPTFIGGADASGTTNSGTGSGAFYSIFVSGNYAYIAKSLSLTNCNTVGNKIGCELQIYDISTPSAPTFIGGADASGTTNSGTGGREFYSIFVSGYYGYITTDGNSTNCGTVGNKIGCELQIYQIGSDTTPPTVSLTAPTDAATISGNAVTVSATASDSEGVTGVSFYANGILINSEDTSSPYSISWDTTATTSGSKIIQAVARDDADNRATSTSRTVTLNNIPTPTSVDETVTASTATLTWTTSKVGSSRVFFGIASSLASSTAETNTGGSETTNHSVVLLGLSSCNVFKYVVVSRSPNALDTATSSESSFQTTDCTGEASISASSSEAVTVSSGGTVTHETLTLDAPADFSLTSSIVAFQVSTLNSATFISSAGSPTGLSLAGDVYHLTAFESDLDAITDFDEPLNITITYEANDVIGLDESSLAIYRYNGATWSSLSSCVVDTVSRTVSCDTSEFSDFGIFGSVLSSVVASTRSTQGSTIQGRIKSLVSMGDYVQAQKLFSEWLFIFSLSDLNELLNLISNQTNTAANPTNSVTPSQPFTRNLKVGMTGVDVKVLQEFLNSQGFLVAKEGVGSSGKETEYFGRLTKDALIRFQETHRESILEPSNLTKGTGNFFKYSREVANEILGY